MARHTFGLMISDLLTIGFAFWLAYEVRFELSLGIFYQNLRPHLTYYQSLVMVLIPVWIIIFYVLGLYDRQKLLGGTQEYSLVFNATTIGIVLLIAAGLNPDFVFARGWLLLAWILPVCSHGEICVTPDSVLVENKGYFLTCCDYWCNNEGLSLAEQLMRWKSQLSYCRLY
jgi:hypothetical protein